MNSALLKKIIKEEITKVVREEESKKENGSFTSEEKEMLTDFGFHPLYGKSKMTYENTIDHGDETMEITLEVEKRDGVFFCSGSTEYGQLKDTKKSNVKSVIAWAKRTIDRYK